MDTAELEQAITYLRSVVASEFAERGTHKIAAERVIAGAEAYLVGWQPIETAPRDGTRVLLVGNVYGGIPFIGAWVPCEFTPDRSWLNCISCTRLYEHAIKCWMPEPDPPAYQDARKEAGL